MTKPMQPEVDVSIAEVMAELPPMMLAHHTAPDFIEPIRMSQPGLFLPLQ
jgi:hypothetical protein